MPAEKVVGKGADNGKTNVGGGGGGTGSNDDGGTGDGGDGDVPPPTSTSSAMLIVGILVPLLLLAGIAGYVIATRKKEQTRQRSFTQSRGPTGINNPTYSVEGSGTINASDEAVDADGGGGGDTYEEPAGGSRSHTAEADEAELYDPVYTMNPLSELEDTPVVSLDQAVATAAVHCGGGPYDEQVELANTFYDESFSGGQRAGGGGAALARADATTIHVYTQETNIYKGLNGALGGYGKGGRSALSHYYQLRKLLIMATRKLPPIEPTTVYRGIQLDHESLLGGLTVGGKLTWWGVTSTTRSPDVLRNDMFLGIGSKSKVDGTLRKDSKRTVFQIRANAGVDIGA